MMKSDKRQFEIGVTFRPWGTRHSGSIHKIRRRILAIAFLIFALADGEPGMAIERAKYTVVTSQAPYEIRDYASSVVAIVAVEGSRSEAVNSGFRLLANYIFGNNQQKSKIAMTSPVTQTPNPSKNSAREGASSGPWIVRFMMPSGYTLESLPTPTDSRVRFEATSAHRAAAIRFSGLWSDANLNAHETQLLQWINNKHLISQSGPTYAYYDPPWTPWFMRTIEVMIDIAPPQ